jgi:hypothetical protein
MFKVIEDKDFLQLLSLYIKMYKVIDPSLSNSVVSIILAEEMKQPRFIAFGVFQEDTLIGLIAGFAVGETEFFSSGIYCESRIKVKELVSTFERWLIGYGYTSWSTEERKHIKPFVHKLGAKVEYIRYKKEL